MILEHYPLESIRSIGILPGAGFRKTFIPLESLRGSTLSLNDIEHEILRKEWFREDFEKEGSTLVGFVARHSDEQTAKALRGGEDGEIW